MPGECTGPSAAPGVAGSPPNFAEIGTPPPVVGGRRECALSNDLGGGAEPDYNCPYQDQLLDSSIATPIWGSGLDALRLPARQTRTPRGRSGTATLASTRRRASTVILTSVKENWDFPTRIGDPTDLSGDTIGSAAAVGTGSTSSLGRAATVSLSGTFTGVRVGRPVASGGRAQPGAVRSPWSGRAAARYAGRDGRPGGCNDIPPAGTSFDHSAPHRHRDLQRPPVRRPRPAAAEH